MGGYGSAARAAGDVVAEPTAQGARPGLALTAGEELLLATCRGDVPGGSTADWLAALALAQHHQLSALLGAALHDAGRRKAEDGRRKKDVLLPPSASRLPPLPAGAWHTLQHHAAAARRRHLRACQELTAVLAALGGIPTLALKGPALAARLYPDGGRLYEDLDIAVRAQDYLLARARLLTIGYRPLSRRAERYQRVAGRDLSFRPPPDEHGALWSVELHWQLHDPATGTLDEGGIWARARDVMIDGHAVRTPGAADTLLLLALNLRQHRFARLKTLCDVDRLLLLEGGEIDWPWLHAQAHGAGMCLALRHSLALARALLGSPTGSLPPCGCEGDLRRRWLAHLASESILLRKRPRHHPSRVLLGLVPLLSLDRARAAAQLVRRRLQLFPEYARYRLGQTLSPNPPY